ncbi:hypothetical protein JCM8097_005119 [Rhodosporidiobolus ruineniae]
MLSAPHTPPPTSTLKTCQPAGVFPLASLPEELVQLVLDHLIALEDLRTTRSTLVQLSFVCRALNRLTQPFLARHLVVQLQLEQPRNAASLHAEPHWTTTTRSAQRVQALLDSPEAVRRLESIAILPPDDHAGALPLPLHDKDRKILQRLTKRAYRVRALSLPSVSLFSWERVVYLGLVASRQSPASSWADFPSAPSTLEHLAVDTVWGQHAAPLTALTSLRSFTFGTFDPRFCYALANSLTAYSASIPLTRLTVTHLAPQNLNLLLPHFSSTLKHLSLPLPETAGTSLALVPHLEHLTVTLAPRPSRLGHPPPGLPFTAPAGHPLKRSLGALNDLLSTSSSPPPPPPPPHPLLRQSSSSSTPPSPPAFDASALSSFSVTLVSPHFSNGGSSSCSLEPEASDAPLARLAERVREDERYRRVKSLDASGLPGGCSWKRK